MKELSIWDITKAVVAIAFVGYLWVQVNTVGDALDRWLNKPEARGITETQIQRIAENVMHAQVVANKAQFNELRREMEESNSKALEAAQAIIKEQGGSITELGQAIGRLNGSINEIKKGGIIRIDAEDPEKVVEIIPADRPDAKGQMIPAGNMYFNPGMKDPDERFTYVPAPLDFYFDIVHTQDDSGDYNEGGVTVSMEVESPTIPYKDARGNRIKDKRYAMDVKSWKYAKKPIRDKKFMFNPRVGLGGALTTEFLAAQLDVSFWSYGKTNVDMDWRFINIGAGGTSDIFEATFVPVSYNIGKLLPIVDNIFLGPAFGVDSDSQSSYGGTLSVPF